mmetsp:Transcript_5604/g.14843  ORF Transcript_5604/g.14843 Transcript_5604/m.14843 type:complete len:266 (+) Transcript_5604:67-864(+)|eukprot:CAMPEP_0115863478 /NCGR_PEP_ID=MMETSP0287-20121206/18709_1 /TAXON_ID=412157 /ORGANISM="Chrysochromulina rotalis, Strain UIO044" /LENGTH=265 /DNA_ID=CAMNT_0003317925 /DNA_START=1 /DNA_END=798 /DNA_ORIENTATION=-
MKKRASSADVAAANKRGRMAGLAAVEAARQRRSTVINHGAGVMPVDAPAPHGGTRYSLLVDPSGAPTPYHVDAHTGIKDSEGKLAFDDVAEFRPSLTPAECIRKGIFGGCYFNPCGGKVGIFGREVAVDYREFPPSWFTDMEQQQYASRRYVLATNCYGVKSGFGQREWEAKGWVHAQDPRGWFQWYCRFFLGRRSADDARQIARWCACASSRGRWRNQLCGAVSRRSGRWDDTSVSPVIRQTLLHWAYELSEADFEAWQLEKRR